MELLGADASPFVRKVRVLLLETGQEDVTFTAAPPTDPVAEAARIAANPLGKIPSLIRPDGPAIHDSRVITRFLDARSDAGLYPDARLWEVLTLESMGDGIMEAALAITYEKRYRPEEMWHQPWMDRQWEKAARTLDAIEAQWMSHLHGPLDMAQIGVACALGYFDLRHDERQWRVGRDALAAWYATFSERPSMVDTAPE